MKLYDSSDELVKFDGSELALPDGARTASGELSAAAREILENLYDFPRCSCDVLTSSGAGDPSDFFAVVSGLLGDGLLEVRPRAEASSNSLQLIEATRLASSSRPDRAARVQEWYGLFRKLESSTALPEYMLAITRNGKRQLDRALESAF